MQDYVHVIREIDAKRKALSFLSDAFWATVLFVGFIALYIITPPYN